MAHVDQHRLQTTQRNVSKQPGSALLPAGVGGLGRQGRGEGRKDGVGREDEKRTCLLISQIDTETFSIGRHTYPTSTHKHTHAYPYTPVHINHTA